MKENENYKKYFIIGIIVILLFWICYDVFWSRKIEPTELTNRTDAELNAVKTELDIARRESEEAKRALESSKITIKELSDAVSRAEQSVNSIKDEDSRIRESAERGYAIGRESSELIRQCQQQVDDIIQEYQERKN